MRLILHCLLVLMLVQVQVNKSLATGQVPIYWINLDSMKERRENMNRHLTSFMGVSYHKRITALTPETCNLIMVDSNCNRVSLADIAIVCSHLSALYTALHDTSEIAQKSKYFVVLEDDVRFQFKVDFNNLIESAPNDFGSLQLMMSHKIQIETAWNHYLGSIKDKKGTKQNPDYFIHRPRNSTVWSAQAVMYNKDIIRSFIDKAVTKDKTGKLGYKLVTSSEYDRTDSAHINPYNPVIACSCLFADMFVYAMAQPSYISTVPFLNSAVQGVNSSYHQAHVVFHLQGFAKAQQIQEDMKKDTTLLPPFLSPLSAPGGGGGTSHLKGSVAAAEEAVDWIDFAKKNPAQGYGVPRRFNNE